MEESWDLNASLGLSWLEKKRSPAKTTISGLQISLYAYVSVRIICNWFSGIWQHWIELKKCGMCTAVMLINFIVTCHWGDSTEFIMAWGAWWPMTLWRWIFNRKFLSLYAFPLPHMLSENCLSVCYCLWFCTSLPPTVPCMSNFTAPSGTVLSPDYPEGYGNNMNCVWLIQSDPGSRIHLAFNDFDLEAPYDSLTVKDGETNDATVIGRFSGAESPSHLTSNTNTLRLEFQADHSMSGRGFNITYSSMYSILFLWPKSRQMSNFVFSAKNRIIIKCFTWTKSKLSLKSEI